MKSRDKKRLKEAASTRRNYRVMALLMMVPEFQQEVREVRRRFKIPPRGYITDYDRNADLNPYDQMDVERANRDSDAKLKQLGFFVEWPFALRDSAPAPSEFQRKVIRIGEKFCLPYNFYKDSSYGIAWYIIRGRVAFPEQNWEIDTDLQISDRALPIRWAVIRAYSPLDDVEAKEAIHELNEILKRGMPKALAKERRIKRDSEKRLDEINDLLEIDPALERGDRVPKNDRQRTMLKRANELAKDLFGYGIKAER